MAARQHTIDIIHDTLLRHYVRTKRPMMIDDLANKSGFSQETIRKMCKDGTMQEFADHFHQQASIGGKLRKRLFFEPYKVTLAKALADFMDEGEVIQGHPGYRKLSDGRIKDTLTGEVHDGPDYEYFSDFPG